MNIESKYFKDPSVSNFEKHWNSRLLEVSMEDWLKYLKHHNDRGIQRISWFPAVELFPSHTIPQIVYEWCHQFQLPSAILHRTLEIYDNFIMAYCKDLYFDRQPHLNVTPQFERAYWQEIFTEIKHQGLLHLVSCFQIASKLELSYKIITVNKAATLLSQARRPCDQSTILQSEIQVLVTLKYDVNYPPIIEYVETLICQLLIMAKKRPSEFKLFISSVDEIHSVSKMLLLVIYYDRQVIFGRIVASLYGTGSLAGSRSYRENLQKVQLNKMLLAAATICAASFLVEPLIASSVMRDIHASADIHPSQLAILSSILVSHLDPNSEQTI